ncbi:hypothetical protein [Stenotrophomonas geniculata]|uniref:hypothetical protein n=1 Tax=Stenotrophomonas geniculata TaxID=86188 RepID=UPI002E7719EA|nr:hypothetical protein [Stenotrophomonas geniculata]
MKPPVGRLVLASALVLVFILVPIWSLVGPGVWGWHVRQPAAWQGALESSALFFALYVALKLIRGAALWAGIAAVSALYARHHGVDVAMLASYIYLEGIFALGGCLVALAGGVSQRDPAQQVIVGMTGLVACSLLLWMASLLGVGTMQALAVLTALVLGGALILRRGPWLGGMLVSGVRRGAGRTPAVTALIATLTLVLFAKASVSSDFDSNWYGLSADRALIASGNIFRSEGLVAPVHYYPKLIELLQVPLAAIGSIPAIIGLSIGCWLATLGVASQILRELRVMRVLRPYIVALLATLPAFANISITAKGDALAALLLAVSLLAVLRLGNKGGAGWLWIAAASSLLASQARLSNIPYTLAIGLLAIPAFIRWRSQRFHRRQPPAAIAGGALLGAIVLVGLITARTWWLAGVPIVAPNAALDLFAAWGMPLQSPVGRLPTSDLLVYLPPGKALLAYLFDPRQYPLLQILWTGNAWLGLPLVAMILGWRRSVAWRRAVPVLLLGLLFFPMLLGNRYIEASGADGNYFITPLLSLLMFAGFLLQQSLWKWQSCPGVSQVVRALVFSIAVASALMCLVTGAWGPGTRAFDTRLDRPMLDTASRRAAAWRDIGLERMAQRLSQEAPRTRAVGDVGGEGFWLPVRYEPIDIIALTRPGLVDTPEHTLEFLEHIAAEYLIVRSPGAAVGQERDRILRTAVDTLAADSRATRVMTEGPYELWRVSPKR